MLHTPIFHHLSKSCPIWLVSCQSNPLKISIRYNMYFSHLWHASINAILFGSKHLFIHQWFLSPFKTSGVSLDFTTTLSFATIECECSLNKLYFTHLPYCSYYKIVNCVSTTPKIYLVYVHHKNSMKRVSLGL